MGGAGEIWDTDVSGPGLRGKRNKVRTYCVLGVFGLSVRGIFPHRAVVRKEFSSNPTDEGIDAQEVE